MKCTKRQNRNLSAIATTLACSKADVSGSADCVQAPIVSRQIGGFGLTDCQVAIEIFVVICRLNEFDRLIFARSPRRRANSRQILFLGVR
jgi:hypothetical protein